MEMETKQHQTWIITLEQRNLDFERKMKEIATEYMVLMERNLELKSKVVYLHQKNMDLEKRLKEMEPEYEINQQ